MSSFIYYLPGHGGHLEKGLGEELMRRGYDVIGRETRGEFNSLPFSSKVDLIAQDLRTMCWSEEALVVANSFGAYLFLHAQAQLKPHIGRVLLLSPIVGEFSNNEASYDEHTDGWMGFIPPMAKKLTDLISSGSYPAPKQCEIHVGEKDWQSNPKKIVAIGYELGIKPFIVPGAGHALPKAYVKNLLDNWLQSK
jgi:pimeloyl-ACP methyl ester carboxylesterase